MCCQFLARQLSQKVTVDGATVLSKSGNRKLEFLNWFPWRRPRNDGYEAHVTPDGIEVRLEGETVWGGAAAFNIRDNTEAGRQERTVWGVSAEDIMD